MFGLFVFGLLKGESMENNMNEQSKVVGTPVCLTPLMIRALDAEASREGLFRGRSVIVRRACIEYLDRHAQGWAEVSIEVSDKEAA